MVVNQQIVPVQAPTGGALATAQPHVAVEGMEELTQADLRLPRWSIAQANSGKDGATEHAGQFMNNISGEFRPYLDAVLLKVSPSRAMFNRGTGEKKPECFSRDGITGSKYGRCSECDFNARANPDLMAALKEAREQGVQCQWKNCPAGYTYILIDDPDTMSMALFGTAGTANDAAMTLNTLIVQRRKPIFSWAVRFTTQKTTNKMGTFYMLKAQIVKELDSDRVQAMRELYRSIQGIVVKDVDEDGEPEASASSGPEPAPASAKDTLF